MGVSFRTAGIDIDTPDRPTAALLAVNRPGHRALPDLTSRKMVILRRAGGDAVPYEGFDRLHPETIFGNRRA